MALMVHKNGAALMGPFGSPFSTKIMKCLESLFDWDLIRIWIIWTKITDFDTGVLLEKIIIKNF